MNILQRYLYREWFVTLVAVSIVLLIVLMGVFLGELLNDMADGRTPSGLLGLQLALHLPEALGNVLPLAGFVAVMWGLGRLYRDHEMAVMRSNGFGWRQMLRPLMLLVAPASAILLLLTFSIAPRASALAEKKLEEAFRTAAVWGLHEGRFHILQGGDLVIYVESLAEDGRTLNNVFIQQKDEQREIVWMARRGEYWMDTDTGQRYLTLMDGQITDNVPNKLDLKVLEFQRNDFKLPEPEPRESSSVAKTRSTAELLAAMDERAYAELQWRLAPAILILVLGLLAVPLAHSNPRESRGIRIVLGVLSYALYANTLYLCRAWIAEGVLSPAVGMWWVHGLVLVVAMIWLQRQGRIIGHG